MRSYNVDDDYRLFRAAWRRAEGEGKCDAWKGAECKRIIGEWYRAGTPRDVYAFIVQRANIQPNETLQIPPFRCIIHNPAYGPHGETFCVIAENGERKETDWFWNQQEALDLRDTLLAGGWPIVRILGLPTVLQG
jgi:hypothetical protein